MLTSTFNYKYIIPLLTREKKSLSICLLLIEIRKTSFAQLVWSKGGRHMVLVKGAEPFTWCRVVGTTYNIRLQYKEEQSLLVSLPVETLNPVVENSLTPLFTAPQIFLVACYRNPIKPDLHIGYLLTLQPPSKLKLWGIQALKCGDHLCENSTFIRSLYWTSLSLIKGYSWPVI